MVSAKLFLGLALVGAASAHDVGCADVGGEGKEHRLLADGHNHDDHEGHGHGDVKGCPEIEALVLQDGYTATLVSCDAEKIVYTNCKTGEECTDEKTITAEKFSLDFSDDDNCYRYSCHKHMNETEVVIGHWKAPCSIVEKMTDEQKEHCEPHHGCEVFTGEGFVKSSGAASLTFGATALVGAVVARFF